MNKRFTMMFGRATNTVVGSLALSGTAFNPPNGVIGTPYSYDCSVCFSGTVTNYSLTGILPSGLSLNTSSGVISGTPTTAETASGLSITAHNTYGPATTTPVQDIVITATPVASTAYNTLGGSTLGGSTLG